MSSLPWHSAPDLPDQDSHCAGPELCKPENKTCSNLHPPEWLPAKQRLVIPLLHTSPSCLPQQCAPRLGELSASSPVFHLVVIFTWLLEHFLTASEVKALKLILYIVLFLLKEEM